MKKIKLMRMSIENFKGIKELMINLNGESISIRGANGTGKTSVKDAYLWCLFGKDSTGRADFKIRPIAKDGQAEITNVETAVTLLFNIDNQQVKLKRVLKEKWTKKRSGDTVIFDGFQTNYFVNDVPMKEKEWTPEVEKYLAKENILRLISDTQYFNNLDMKKKREILIDGQAISDKDIANGTPDFRELVQYLEQKTVDELRKMVAYQNKEYKSKQENIAPRIDELNKQMTVQDDVLVIKNSQIRLKELENAKAELKASTINTNALSDKYILQKQVDALQMNKQTLINQDKLEYSHLANTQKNKLNELLLKKQKSESDLSTSKTRHDMLEAQKKDLTIFASKLKEKITTLQGKYVQFSNKVFEATTCHACGQALPEHLIQDLQDKFNIEKSNELEQITAEGIAKASERKEIMRKIADIDTSVKVIAEETSFKNSELVEINNLIEQETNKLSSLEWNPNPLIKELEEQISKLEMQIVEVEVSKSTGEVQNNSHVEEQIYEIESQIASLRRDIGQAELNISNKSRIDILVEEQKELSENIEHAINLLNMCDKFMKYKMTLIADSINSQFKLVKFQLFETQINGGVNEVCVATVDNVPFNDLNTATKLNAGLDIINTLSAKYNITAPIFVDNAESVSAIDTTYGQQIQLYVDQNFKILNF